MLTALTINSFRGFRNLSIDGFSKINLIVGKNNEGKTSILEAIYSITSPFDALAIFRPTMLRKFRVDVGSIHYLFHQMDVNQEILLDADFKGSIFDKRAISIKNVPLTLKDFKQANQKKQRKLSIETIPLAVTTDQVGALEHTGTLVGKKSLRARQKFSFDSDILSPASENSSPIDENQPNGTRLHFQLDQRFEDLNGSELQNPENIDLQTLNIPFIVLGMIEEDRKVLTERWDTIKKTGEHDSVLTALRLVDARIKDIYFDSDFYFWAEIENWKKTIPMRFMGDGINKIFEILISIPSAKNGFVLIDEIENGLYYSTLQNLWSAISTACEHYNVQLFATTHSHECIRAFSEYEHDIQDRSLLRIEMHQDKHYCQHYSLERLQRALENGWETR